MSKVKTTKPVSEKEINQVANILSRFEPGFLPLPIFLETARLTVTPAVELVPFRRTKRGGIEVLLTRRDEDDTFWPNLLHNPGSVVRATDSIEGEASVLKRIYKEEIGIEYQEAVFVTHIFQNIPRGYSLSNIYWTELKQNPPTGEFYDAHNLPEDMINTNVEVVNIALEHYLKY